MTRNEILQIAKPILFNTEMVKAILEGRKTVTRRAIKPPAEVHECSDGIFVTRPRNYPDEYCRFEPYCPIKIGDYLYVRETWKRFCGILYGRENGTYIPLDDFEGYQYKSDEQCICTKGVNPFCDCFDDFQKKIRFDDKWHPSIHMPKEAARIFLRVTDVRVERLQDITITGLQEEGILNDGYVSQYAAMTTTAFEDFKELWNSTIKKSGLDKYGWDANPWVWSIKFVYSVMQSE